MMKPNITPGPWEDNAGTVWMENPVRGKCAVVHPHNSPQSIANAQAIAALPDLLAALEMALVQIKQDNDERKAEYRGTQVQIESALIKAGYTF